MLWVSLNTATKGKYKKKSKVLGQAFSALFNAER